MREAMLHAGGEALQMRAKMSGYAVELYRA